MTWLHRFARLVPDSAGSRIAWEEIGPLLAASCFQDLQSTPQNPVFHGEGDVLTHTRMVCGELNRKADFHALDKRVKTELFLAAVLHDLGKAKTTRLDGGAWVSPHHAAVGSQLVRIFLWRDCGLSGTMEALSFRETVCALVRHHMVPFHLVDQEEAALRARTAAAAGVLAKDFSWALTGMLAEADARGRDAGDIEEYLSQIQLSMLLAGEAGCLRGPCRFQNSYTARACLSGRNVGPDQCLYDDTWGEVIMMSGLPGTGKDTWIRRHHPDLPVVSMDDIRREMGVRPTEEQGAVVQAARDRVREHLRGKQPFIWNATSLTRENRAKLVSLCERYGARVRIVYLETDPETRQQRNAGRPGAVPESAVARMLDKTVPPMPDEAQTVEWVCV